MEIDFSDVKDVAELRQKGNIFFLVLNTAENRLNPDSLSKIHAILNTVEQEARGPSCLVTTNTSDKIFSNGLDLDWIANNLERGEENA